MADPTAGPLRPRVLVVDDELAKLDTALGRAVENLAAALEARNIDVLKAISFEDGQAVVVSDASIRAVLLDWNLGTNTRVRTRRRPLCYTNSASGMRPRRYSSSQIASAPGAP